MLIKKLSCCSYIAVVLRKVKKWACVINDKYRHSEKHNGIWQSLLGIAWLWFDLFVQAHINPSVEDLARTFIYKSLVINTFLIGYLFLSWIRSVLKEYLVFDLFGEASSVMNKERMCACVWQLFCEALSRHDVQNSHGYRTDNIF